MFVVYYDDEERLYSDVIEASLSIKKLCGDLDSGDEERPNNDDEEKPNSDIQSKN
jgi:hypothetical protein